MEGRLFHRAVGRLRLISIVTCAVLGVSLTVGLVAALAASSSSPSATAATSKVVLKVGWLNEPDNINPTIGTTMSAYTVWYLNYDVLVGLNTGTLAPEKGAGLATDWSFSTDQKTWTFKLRHNAMWQDGQPVTAADVAFTYNFIIKNEIGNFTGYTQGILSAAAPDPYTVVMTCAQPKANMLTAYIPILPQHIWGKMTVAQATKSFANNPPIIGSGPFECMQFKRGMVIRMVANKSYWGGAPKIDEVDFDLYQNADTMGADMKSGAIDAATALLSTQVKQLNAVPGVKAEGILVNGFDELGINCYTGQSLGNPVLRDWRFRQALNWAVDKKKLIEFAYSGYGTPGDTPITANYYSDPNWHWTPPASEAYSFDLAKASQALDAAGYKLIGGKRCDKRGKPITLRLWSRSASPTSDSVGKLLAGGFDKLGINIVLSSMDDGTLNARLYNTDKHGNFYPDYDMFLWGWYDDIDPNTILADFTTAQINSSSDCAWSNKEYDRLYELQGRTLDQTKRKALVDRMQEILYEQSPYIILAYSNDREAWNVAKWQGWVRSPKGFGNMVIPPYGTGSFMTVELKHAAAKGGGSSTGIIIGVVAAVVVVGGVVLVLIRRRKPSLEEA